MAGFIQTARTLEAPLPYPELDWAAGQKVLVSVSAIASSAIDSKLILVSVSTASLITVGDTPVAAAAAGSLAIKADEPVILAITRGQKVSVISNSGSTGACYILPAKEGQQPALS